MASTRFALLPLLLIAATHFVVDTVAAALNPLWPSFETHYGLGATGVFWLYFAWTVATSVCQLVFGLWGEWLRGPWLLWCGPAIATLCLTTFGMQPRLERVVLWLIPAAAALPLLMIPQGTYSLMCVATTISGLLFGFAQPVLIGYGQQLLPRRQRVASSLTMGVTWGVGGAAISAFMALLVAHSWVDSAFAWFAGASVLSSLLCFWLPPVE